MNDNSNVTMQKIAELLDVSVVTVSRALNDKDGVSARLKAIIKQKAEELGYRPNIFAKGLKTQQSFNIGILIANRYIDTHDAYYLNVYSEMVKKMVQLDYSGIMEILAKEDELENKLPHMYLERKIDGMIVLGQLENDYLKNLESIDIPLLYVDFYLNHSKIDSIVTDNFYSSYQLTTELIQKGHKEIGFVGNIFSTSSIQDRFLGYYKALLESHIVFNQGYLVSDRDGLGHLIDIKLPKKMPTAFVVNCDVIAYKFIETLNKNNYHVPNDVSVVGFDNSIYALLSPVEITTVDNNIVEMVDKAITIMVKKIKNPNRTYGRVLISGNIIKRSSSREIK